MNDKAKNIPWVNAQLFNENNNKFSAEELLPYAGKYVAWSLDGTQILASGDNEMEMDQRLRQLGIDPSQVVGEYIPPPDTTIL